MGPLPLIPQNMLVGSARKAIAHLAGAQQLLCAS